MTETFAGVLRKMGRAVPLLVLASFLALAVPPPSVAPALAQSAAPAAGTPAPASAPEAAKPPAGPPAAAASQAAPVQVADMMSMEASMSLAFRVRAALKEVLEGARGFGDRSAEMLAKADPSGGTGWLWRSLVVLALAVAGGLAALSLVERWGRGRLLRLQEARVAGRADRIGFLLSRALIMLAALAAFAAVSVVVVLALDSGHHAARITGFAGLYAVAMILLLRLVFLNVLAPDAASHRVIPFPDKQAQGLYRMLIGTAVAGYLLAGGVAWMDRLGLDRNAMKLAEIAVSLLVCLLLIATATVYRRPISRIIAGEEAAGEKPAAWRYALQLLWFPVTVVYFLLAWVSSAVRLLLNLPAATGLVAAPIMALLIGLVVYGLLVLVLDKWLLPRLDSVEAKRGIAEDLARKERSEGVSVDLEANVAQAEAEAMEREAARSPYRELLDQGGRIIALAAATAYLLVAWGVPLTDERNLVVKLTEVGLIVLAGYMAYRAVQIAIDRKIALEKGGDEDKSEEMEIGGKGETRLATLLPLFRNFLLISIVVLGTMIVLSELGVNIAPLFAGAGVVGLAVGFGAQTLIRDIFSGAFFLIDDAFRKGEYIDIGSVKGTVEKISIRSMQLRHHRGPLNTVPFGEIQHVTNYSRDWAIMKLAFRVTYDTDVDKMRKLIKKFGQQLLEDPEIGPKFLQPVKSQGVTDLDDSAMIVRVKFMTRPGDQFELRKVVYAGIRDLCAQEGIKFAHREVTVHVTRDKRPDEEADAEEGQEQMAGGDDLTDEEAKAVGGAVLPIVDDAAKGKPAA